MKRMFVVLMTVIVAFLGFSAGPVQANEAGVSHSQEGSILFLNTSRNREGNTDKMGKALLQGLDYEQLNLVDYRLNQPGQTFEGDQLDEVLAALEKADTIVIGTPVYWQSMSGSLKTLLDRLYEVRETGNPLEGKTLYFFIQGSAPTPEAISQAKYVMTRVAGYMSMEFGRAAANDQELADLRESLMP